MTSALFGPDGTQPPEPEPVLPDSLLGSSASLGGAAQAQPIAAGPPQSAASDFQGPDLDRMRRAIAEALGVPAATPEPASPPATPLATFDTTPPADMPVEVPPQAPLELAATSEPATPPTGIPLPPVPPVTPLPASAQAGYPPYPSVVPAQSPQRRAPYRPPGQRVDRRPARNPLVQERRISPAGGWIGCLVVLIAFGTVAFSLLQSLIAALLDLFR